MPRSMDLDTELNALLQYQAEGQTGLRQYVSKFPIDTAIKIVEDCMVHDEKVTDGLRRMVSAYFEAKEEGRLLGFNDFQTNILDALCRATGESRESVIKGLITEYGLNKLVSIKNALNTAPTTPAKQD